MNIILEQQLQDFCKDHNFLSLSQAEKFEHFVNYLIVSYEHDGAKFDIKDLHTGNAAQGIDGIAIIVNNRLCISPDEITELIKINNRLDVEFIFIQTKTSAKFDGGQIETFFRWTKTFFKFGSEFKTEQMKNFIAITKKVFDNSKYFKNYYPKIKLYYACTGLWEDNENLVNNISQNKTEMEKLSLFGVVNFVPCGAKQLQEVGRKISCPIEAEIFFERKITLPDITGVSVAYSGFLPFSEFKKLIIDDNNKLRPVFDDNIRGFLGIEDNPVNEAMRKTLKEQNFDEFPILNNGVTIVAEKITGPGTKINIFNYQIVNGCQTSNVLFDCRDVAGIDNILIPVKIIATENSNLRINVTRSTNNQTKVSIEQLESLEEFQKELEQYYNSYFARKQSETRLYYERRKNQYKDLAVSSSTIIDVENQIKNFAAMFLEKPYIVSGYYSKLLKGLREDIFCDDHKLIAYLCSSLSYYKLVCLFNNQKIDNALWRFRYHIIMLLKYFVTKKFSPKLENKHCDNYCEEIISVLLDESRCEKVFLEIADFLKSIDNEIKISGRKSSEKKKTTEIILEIMRSKIFDNGQQTIENL